MADRAGHQGVIHLPAASGTAQGVPWRIDEARGDTSLTFFEWNALAAGDEFARLSMERLGEVICENGPDAPGAIPPELEAFCRRHGLFHCMAITVELPGSGMMFFVSVYRPPQGPPFSGLEAGLFGEFVAHLLCHWRHALQRLQAAFARFASHNGALQPHFAYGSLSHAEYAQAHVLHLYNHLSRLGPAT